jgi:hypothetical protein
MQKNGREKGNHHAHNITGIVVNQVEKFGGDEGIILKKRIQLGT